MFNIFEIGLSFQVDAAALIIDVALATYHDLFQASLISLTSHCALQSAVAMQMIGMITRGHLSRIDRWTFMSRISLMKSWWNT